MNEIEVRRFLELIKPNENDLMEVRIIDERKRSFSGYFTDKELLVKSIKSYNEKYNVYLILNTIKSACYSRLQRDKIMQDQTTTSDNDIEARDWLFIDIDAKRPSNVCATQQEVENSKKVGRAVYLYLKKLGFFDPIVCMSGNGTYLLYKINLVNTEATKDLVRDCLLAIDMLFSNPFVDIDTSVFNAGRIGKIIGTVSRKGSNTDDRPHRLSEILSVPNEVRINEKPLLEKLAAQLPKPEKKTYQNNYGQQQFNIDDFINTHNISIKKVQNFSKGTKYVLENCPFCGHSAPDSAIFKLSDGSFGFKCFHNSCSNKTWKDFREYYEPLATRNYGDNRFTYNKTDNTPQPIKKANNDNISNVWLTMPEIKQESREDIISMPMLYTKIDEKIIGLNKSETSVWSGLNSSGKTTALAQVTLNWINQGFDGAIWSGEMRNSRLQNWYHMIAAGRTNNVKALDKNYYYTPQHIRNYIDTWLDKKLYVYNDKCTNDFNAIYDEIRKLLDKTPLSWIVLDNLMALDLLNVGDKENDRQTKAILKIVELGKEYNVHMNLVAHPRKTATFLRKEDIGGTGNLSNAVDNVFIVHRVNRDFQRRGEEFYDKELINDVVSIGYGNVIETCKNRDLGQQDFLTPLFYEVESKRFLNERLENMVYNWVDIMEQKTINTNNQFEPNYGFDLPY